MHANRVLVVALVFLLAGCPTTNNEAGSEAEETLAEISAFPGTLLIRDDTEVLRVGKTFASGVGTNFPESISGIDIEVVDTPEGQCPIGPSVDISTAVTHCEDWEIRQRGATSAVFTVTTIVPATFRNPAPGSITNVHLIGNSPGARRATKVTGDGATVLTEDGQVWSRGDEVLARGDNYFVPRDAKMSFAVRSDQLPPVTTDVSATALAPDSVFDNGQRRVATVYYGLALSDDNRIFEWGWHQSQPGFVGDGGQGFDLNFTNEDLARVVRYPLREMVEFETLSQGSAIDWVQVTALQRPEDAENTDNLQSFTRHFDLVRKFLRVGIVGAALSADGRVAVWGDPTGTYAPQLGLANDINRTPRWLPSVDRVVKMSTENGALILLRDSGTVLFGNGRSLADPVRPALVAPMGDFGRPVIDIAGMRALRNDGTVWQWQLNPDGFATPAQQVPGLTNAVALPDPAQNVAILADGSLVEWSVDPDSGLPHSLTQRTIGNLASVADVSGGVVIDSDCGRAWSIPDQRPWIGPADIARCETGDTQQLVHLFIVADAAASRFVENLTSSRQATVTASTGQVQCDGSVGRFVRCLWTGNANDEPVFTAHTPSGLVVRDWRWDCQGQSERSLPLTLPSGEAERSASLCKVTLTTGAGDSPVPERRILSVQADGPGSVTSSPAGIDCGMQCEASFDVGATVSLTATAETGARFLGWADTGCTTDRDSVTIRLSLDNNVTCIAAFAADSPMPSPPVANFVVLPSTMVMVGDTVTLDATASFDDDGVILEWSWDLDGDGAEDLEGETVTTGFSTPGTRFVTLTVTDNDGLTGLTSVAIVVGTGTSAPPVADFTISPSATQVLGSTFSFDASSSSDDEGITSYAWDFGADGTFEATGVQHAVTPTAVGVFGMRLRVMDADGQIADQIQSITVENSGTRREYTLSVIVNGPGQVDVAPFGRTLPDGSCDGNECLVFNIPSNTMVTLTARPSASATFQGWSSSECSAIPSPDICQIVVVSERSVTANFN